MEAVTRRFWRSLEPTQRSHSPRCASAIQIVRPYNQPGHGLILEISSLTGTGLNVRAPRNQDTAQNHPGLCSNFFRVESPA